MAVLQVVKYGHPALRQKAQSCKPEEVDAQFIEDMIETMRALDGAGLAATQVNISKQLLVAVEPDKGKIYVLLNPVIIARSEKMITDNEGCLSLPKLQAEVTRHEKVIVRAQTSSGENIEITTKGLFARILQHEIDHLNGILYIDRAKLDTLVWLKKKQYSDDIEKQPTELGEVQHEFRRRYHANSPDVIFVEA